MSAVKSPYNRSRVESKMKGSREEHRVTNIQFAMVEDPFRNGVSAEPTTRPLQVDPMRDSSFSLPSVTVVSPSRSHSKSKKKRWYSSSACLLRLLILSGPLIYHNEIVLFLNQMIPQTNRVAPHIQKDYSAIQGIDDLPTNIDTSRCFRGLVDCKCADPMDPTKGQSEQWQGAYRQNAHMARSEKATNVDVVFYGDSIIERWLGREKGVYHRRYRKNLSSFNKHFSREYGAYYDGIGLGIASDTSPNLLYRVANEELPGPLNPSVFWVLIGTNDMAEAWCSPEYVVVGILRVVEEILLRKPECLVVINALLPRSFIKSEYPGRGANFKPSLWDDISVVNDQLETYANYRDRVHFFETTVFFETHDGETEGPQINSKLLLDDFHPSARGYDVWGQEIVEILDELLEANGPYR